MAIISKGAVAKGTPSPFTLNKSDLELHSLVSADPILSDMANWKKVVLEYGSSESNQAEIVAFDVAQDPPVSDFFVSSFARGDFLVRSIRISGPDGYTLNIPRSALTPAQFDILLSVILGSGIGWGYNFSGVIGDNSTTNRSVPVNVVGQSDFFQISGGNSHNIAIKDNGIAWSWGGNGLGQLGHNDIETKSSPVQVVGQSNFKMADGSRYFSMFLKSDGTLWSCGSNNVGQLGLNETFNKSSLLQVVGQSDFKYVACSKSGAQESTLAIKSDGTMWGCGHNVWGQLGLNDLNNKSSMVQVVGQSGFSIVALGGDGSAIALKSNGTMWVTGNQNNLSLGIGDFLTRSSFVQVTTQSDFAKISAGPTATYAIKSDGTLWVVGTNSSGQLALGDTAHRSLFTQVTDHSNFAKVTAGGDFVIALKSDGTIWGSGLNTDRQLGLGDTSNRSSFVQITGTNVFDIAAGQFHGSALRTN